MKDVKTIEAKIFVLLSNIPQNFSCDYVDQTAKILNKTNPVIVAYYTSPYAVGYLVRNRNKFIEIVKTWKQIIFSRTNAIYNCEFISLLPFQRSYCVYEINKLLTRNQINILLFLRWLFSGKREKRVLWVYHPSAEFFVGHTGEKISLYDCVDYIEILSNEKNDLFKLEEKLLKKVDLFFANSLPLAETKKSIRNKVIITPCGCAVDAFPLNYKPKAKPDALKKIKTPIVGFFGHLDYRIDFDLVEYLLAQNKNISFLFLGKVLDKISNQQADGIKVSERIKGFSKYPNFHLVAPLSKEELKDCLYYYNVGIIPYDIDYEVVKYSNPMKFYEYLAMGIPVVSVPIPALGGYHLPVVKFVKTKGEFSSSLNKLLADPNLKAKFKNKCRIISKKNSWEAKIGKILIELEKK